MQLLSLYFHISASMLAIEGSVSTCKSNASVSISELNVFATISGADASAATLELDDLSGL